MKYSKVIKNTVISSLILCFSSHFFAQAKLHDKGLYKQYQKMSKKEMEFTAANGKSAAILLQEEQRIKLLIKNLSVTKIQVLLPAFEKYINRSKSIIDVIDRSEGLLSFSSPWRNNKIYLFFFDRKKREVRKKLNQLNKNVKLFFRPDNYMTEADRALLLYDALMKANYYVLRFAIDSFSEFEEDALTITDDIFIE